MNLNQVFSRTLASTPAAQERADRESDQTDDPQDSYSPPTDSVYLNSGSSGPVGKAFNSSGSNGAVGLPSLSKSYSSHSGGLLDIVG